MHNFMPGISKGLHIHNSDKTTVAVIVKTTSKKVQDKK